MAASLNKIELLGVLANEPFMRQSFDGEQICCFSLRVEIETLNMRNEPAREVCLVDVEASGALGQAVMNFFHKDSPVFVDGRLKYETYIDRQTGRKMTRHLVTAVVIQSAIPDNSPVPEPPATIDYQEGPMPNDDSQPFDGASGMSF